MAVSMQTTTMALRPCGSTMQRMRTPCSPTPLFAANRAQPRRSHVKIGVLGGVLGLGLGIGAPIFYSLRDDRDEERLEELRALNRATFKETGEYLTEEEIAEIRPPRWTDRREFVDDD